MAIPENRKIPSIQVKDLLEPDSNQIIEVGGVGIIATVLRRPETVTVIDFISSGEVLRPTLPVYDVFSVTGIDRANIGNEWDILFSCTTVPNILNPNLTESFIFITGIVLTGHANLNRITMKLDYLYNEDTNLNELKLITKIVQQTGANEDPLIV